ncbi:hypothetical protein K2173_004326 [Erythroxylum novogranatense]|uniref:Gnk2-homologous domain-containing protein n=1 Tax=Erythroxylum novogranatense TaxID=1862640 RepID=A0AAV8T5P2_9ROSI|nr:hypothetical protein K2173_004326 [Erythroxylum novogranatense]
MANFSGGSAYESNLHQLIKTLDSNCSLTPYSNGFYNISIGKTDTINAIGLCRGDKKPDACHNCIKNISRLLPQLCPNKIEVFGAYDDCMLRYTSRPIFRHMDFTYYFAMNSSVHVPNAERYHQVLDSLINELKSMASSGDSNLKYASGSVLWSNSIAIYALTQCTPDLSFAECYSCLSLASAFIPSCCDGRAGGRVVSPSCNVRFEPYMFFDTDFNNPSLPPPPAPVLEGPSPVMDSLFL